MSIEFLIKSYIFSSTKIESRLYSLLFTNFVLKFDLEALSLLNMFVLDETN